MRQLTSTNTAAAAGNQDCLQGFSIRDVATGEDQFTVPATENRLFTRNRSFDEDMVARHSLCDLRQSLELASQMSDT